MNAFQAIALLLVAAGGTAVVLTRDAVNQSMVLSIYGLLLTVTFMALQAPDVALSELAIGAAALPLMLVVTAAKIRKSDRFRDAQKRAGDERSKDGGGEAEDGDAGSAPAAEAPLTPEAT